MFNFFKKNSPKVENKNNNFEIELTASVLAYEIARSDGDISESEISLLYDEIKKISAKVGKKEEKILEIIEEYSENIVSFHEFINDINKNKVLSSHNYLKNKDLNKIILSQKLATEKVFIDKNIPFRSFEIINRSEKTLGELFCFFILETILLGRALNVNPYDQPSVELIKRETKKLLF